MNDTQACIEYGTALLHFMGVSGEVFVILTNPDILNTTSMPGTDTTAAQDYCADKSLYTYNTTVKYNGFSCGEENAGPFYRTEEGELKPMSVAHARNALCVTNEKLCAMFPTIYFPSHRLMTVAEMLNKRITPGNIRKFYSTIINMLNVASYAKNVDSPATEYVFMLNEKCGEDLADIASNLYRCGEQMRNVKKIIATYA